MTARAKRNSVRKNRPRGVLYRKQRRGPRSANGVECRFCGLVRQAGKWSFAIESAERLEPGLCPACRRVRERDPAGTLRLPAALLKERRATLRLIRNVEAAENAEHPLERLIAIEETGGRLVVTTTGVHLARELAHKLAKQLHEKPRFRFAEGEEQVEVDWDEPG